MKLIYQLSLVSSVHSGQFGSLDKYIQDEIAAEEARGEREKLGKRVLVIPVNTFGHWELMVVSIDDKNQIQGALYFNSLEEGAEGKKIFKERKALFHQCCERVDLEKVVQYIQSDGSACGALLCENAFVALKFLLSKEIDCAQQSNISFKEKKPSEESAVRCRAEHARSMGGIKSAFYKKQLENKRNDTVSVLKQLQLYGRWNNDTKLSKEGVKLVDLVFKLCKANKTVLIEALLPEKDEEHKTHLNRLRAACVTIVVCVKNGKYLDDMPYLENIFQVLFGCGSDAMLAQQEKFYRELKLNYEECVSIGKTLIPRSEKKKDLKTVYELQEKERGCWSRMR